MIPSYLKLPSVGIIYETHTTPDQYTDLYKTENSNVSVLHFLYDSLGIDDARDIAQFLTGGDQTKIVVVFSQVITPEAQNYFLKPLEELHEHVKIVFAFSGRPNLLPTFLSRGIVINTSPPTLGEGGALENILISDFITASIPERLKIIEGLLSDENKNHQSVETFLQALYRYIRDEKSASEQIIKNHAVFIHDLPDLLSYASVRGASHKMILEYIACLI